MPSIILMPFHWASDMNSTFGVARKLKERGHRVIYLCIPDGEERIRSQGFEFLPIFSRVFPSGSIAEQDARQAKGEDTGMDTFKARFRGMCEDIVNGEIEKSLDGVRPDLFLTSSGMPWVGIGAIATGSRVISFSSTLISVFDSMAPPFSSTVIPRGTLSSRLKTSFAWEVLFLRRSLFSKVQITDDLKRLARSCNYPVRRIDTRVETWPRLLMPELVFCPREFDFPRRRNPEGAAFVEASIDTQRIDTEFPWKRIEGDKPLVYCTLGTVVTVSSPGRAGEFFRMFIELMAKMPDLQGVVVLGNHLNVADFEQPPNVVVVNEAPQVEILERASLMVSHGGIGGIKEAVFMGVPMILIPLFYDQPGNAARAVYHGIGAALPLKELNAPNLRALIRKILGDKSYSEKVNSMSRIFRETEDRAPSISIIEQTLAG